MLSSSIRKRAVSAALIAAASVGVLVAAFFLLHVIIAGQVFSIFEKSIDLSGRELSGVEPLSRCFRLESLDLRGTQLDSSQISSLKSSLDGCDILYDVVIGGQKVTSNTESIVIDQSAAEDCSALLLLDRLEYADITNCELTDSIIETAADSRCSFLWKLTLCGSEVFSNEAELSLDSPSREDIDKLKLFSGLEKVHISGDACFDELMKILPYLDGCDVTWIVDLCGIELDSRTQSVDLSCRTVGDYGDFSQKLAYLPALTYLDMCDCGLTNEQMGALREQYPEKKFVWKVTFGASPVWWTVRTDITCFSMLGRRRCNNEQLAPLLTYCTDLVALDLGHSNIDDFTPFSKLTDLQVLILGDNDISDISAITSLKKLQYLEMFSTRITDFSPLAELPELVDVCIGGNHLDDISYFLSMKQLKMLWIPHCGLTCEQQDQLLAGLPDCTFKFTVKKNLCEDWRVTDRNVAIRKAFQNWQYVVRFNSWDDVVYVDGVALKEPKIEYLR